MSFNSLNKDELAKVAEFFQKDVVAANEDKGPSKNELLAALASDADGSDPVSWEDYNDIYLKAEKPEVTEEEKPEPKVEAKSKPVEDKKDTSNHVLIKYKRNNPTFEIVGYTFTTRHPFASVPPEVAEYLVRNIEGFSLALPSEVTDYYG